VEVEISGFDLIRAISDAKNNGSRIGVIGFQNVIYGTKNIEAVLNVYIKELVIHSEKDVPVAVKEALYDNIEVIIGDVVSIRWAQGLGLGTVLITSGKEAISLALYKAVEIATIRRNERVRAEQFKIILDYSHEGIIATNPEGQISVMNPAAEKILGINAQSLSNKPVSEVLPFLQMGEVLETGKSALSRLCRVGGKLIVQNTIPIKANDMIGGVISTFQDAKYFEEVESKVRQKLHLKGHVAQYSFNDIVTQNPGMQNVIRQAKSYALVDSTILITGETGTGKELLAQSIHNASNRKNNPFIAINCAAIPESLLESELFGYVEGAFTGAAKGGKKGFFELAHGGTLFLDEIGEIPLTLQSHLLRVLQQKTIIRIGDDHVTPTDVRVIAATHRDLKSAVDQGAFRRDLYYRLNVLRLHLPSLRERIEDIPILIELLVKRFATTMGKEPIKISTSVANYFQQYSWEGNVRELENIIERLMILKSGLEVTAENIIDLFPDTRLSKNRPDASSKLIIELDGTLEDMEKQIIRRVLADTNDKDKTCKLLGISNTTLWRRISKWGISI
jgi:transcriptional regulator with PAS, ATPase and Fis domain